MAQVVQNEVDKLLAADPQQRKPQLAVLHDAFIHGWPPSTPTTTNPCAAWPAFGPTQDDYAGIRRVYSKLLYIANRHALKRLSTPSTKPSNQHGHPGTDYCWNQETDVHECGRRSAHECRWLHGVGAVGVVAVWSTEEVGDDLAAAVRRDEYTA